VSKDSNVLFHKLRLSRTGPTSLQLAILALKDVPMWPAMAHGANPLNERRFGFQEIKIVVAVTRNCHSQIALVLG